MSDNFLIEEIEKDYKQKLLCREGIRQKKSKELIIKSPK
jgi:hypothetical protein